MNEQLQAKLITYLDAIERTASVEVPEVIREYLLWLAVGHAVDALMFTVPLVIWLCVKRRIKRAIDTLDPMTQESATLPYQFVTVLVYALLIGFVINAMQVVKVIVAPRVVLVEQAAKITRGAR